MPGRRMWPRCPISLLYTTTLSVAFCKMVAPRPMRADSCSSDAMLPLLLANLVSLGQVGVIYQPAIEQMLVLAPHAVAAEQGAMVANHDINIALQGPLSGLQPQLRSTAGLSTDETAHRRAVVDRVDVVLEIAGLHPGLEMLRRREIGRGVDGCVLVLEIQSLTAPGSP